jgi:hypothetical protein
MTPVEVLGNDAGWAGLFWSTPEQAEVYGFA